MVALMRILIVNNVLPVAPVDGGRIRKLQHLAALAPEHEVWVLGRAPDSLARDAFAAAHPGCRVVTVPEPDDPSRNPIARAVRELVASQSFDCIHVSGFPQWPGERGFGTAYVVLDIDSLEGVVLQRMRDAGAAAVSSFAVAATDALTRFACERADLVLACSDVDAAAIREAVPAARVEVVPNGVDVAALDGMGPIPRNTPPVVTFTGFLSYWPNADACTWFADEILPRVRARVGHVVFRVVGRVPPADVMDLALREGIEVIPDVPAMHPYFAAADVLVAPIRAGSGTRVKILEAFAAGRPVVSTSVGCEGLPVTSGEQLLIADEPDGFADAVAELIANRPLAARLAAAASVLVRSTFDLPVVGARLRETYRSLADAPARSRLRPSRLPVS
jgi:polysaccharide biosynthesis protein PslH